MPRDYYEVLGVQKGADKDEIKRAFRKLAREYHPDVSQHKDAEARFKEINEAYEVLGDDDKRARYDRFGPAGVGASSGYSGTGGVGVGFEDIFEEFFNNFAGASGRSAAAGGTGGRTRARPGADRRIDVTIEFDESIFGVDKEVEYDRLEVCETCSGVGAAVGTSPTTCPMCQGAGEIRQVQQTFLGSMVRLSSCPQCGGKGTIVETPCQTCTGSGRRRKRVKRMVQIPAGVHEGLQIQIRSGGDVGDGATAQVGNLYVVVHVNPHAYFKRRENDVILDLSINVAQAALGDKILTPTLEGDVEITIPAGTQTGKVFRLRGKGAPRLRSDGTSAGKGDQMIYITVEIPQQLTDKQRQLFEQLAATLGNQVQPQNQGRGFFDRVMEFFNGDQQ
ncbi:MAG: molecular chaperone DnaJ [Phototrophicaceae bacterium]|jgi:molecular chaperone DnaJ